MSKGNLWKNLLDTLLKYLYDLVVFVLVIFTKIVKLRSAEAITLPLIKYFLNLLHKKCLQESVRKY